MSVPIALIIMINDGTHKLDFSCIPNLIPMKESLVRIWVKIVEIFQRLSYIKPMGTRVIITITCRDEKKDI